MPRPASPRNHPTSFARVCHAHAKAGVEQREIPASGKHRRQVVHGNLQRTAHCRRDRAHAKDLGSVVSRADHPHAAVLRGDHIAPARLSRYVKRASKSLRLLREPLFRNKSFADDEVKMKSFSWAVTQYNSDLIRRRNSDPEAQRECHAKMKAEVSVVHL